VLKSHNKLQITLIINKVLLQKNVKNTAFWPKTRYFGKITAFDENHGFRDFRVSMIFYRPYR